MCERFWTLPLLQLFEHLVGGRGVFGFDAPDLTIDLAVSGCEPSELVIRFGQSPDQRRLIGELVSEFVGNAHEAPRPWAQLIMRDRRSAFRWIKRHAGAADGRPIARAIFGLLQVVKQN